MRKVAGFLMLIAFIGFAFMAIFGQGIIPFISRQEINGILIYKYDYYSYIEEIRQTFTNTAVLELHLPTTDFSGPIEALKTLTNMLILLINFLMYPVRLGFYALRTILSIIGLPVVSGINNTELPLNWLYVLMEQAVQFQVPYL